MKFRKGILLIAVWLVAAASFGCGQKGALYLPDQQSDQKHNSERRD